MTVERQELHELVDDLDESDVRAVLELVKSRNDATATKPPINALEWITRAMDPSRPKLRIADQLVGVEPIKDVRQLVHATAPMTDEERAALQEFLDS